MQRILSNFPVKNAEDKFTWEVTLHKILRLDFKDCIMKIFSVTELADFFFFFWFLTYLYLQGLNQAEKNNQCKTLLLQTHSLKVSL